MRRTLPALFLFLVLSNVAAGGTTRYVGTTGCSDSGTGTNINSPWCTVSYSVGASSATVAGDTVIIKGGTYTQFVQFRKGGSAGNYITLVNYNSTPVILDGSGLGKSQNWEGIIDITGYSYINITGLKIKNSGGIGMFVKDATYLDVRNNYWYNFSQSAIRVTNISNHINFTGNEVIKCGMLASGTAQECVSFTDANVSYWNISDNIVHDNGMPTNGREGIDVKNAVKNGVISNNTVYNLTGTGILIDAYAGFAQDIEVYRNVVYNVSGNGIGIGAENGGGAAKNISMYNNIVYNVASNNGFQISTYHDNTVASSITNISIYNNVVYNNSKDTNNGGILIGQKEYPKVTVSNIKVINNILSNNTGYQIKNDLGTNVIIDHNLIYKWKNAINETNGTAAIFGDPLFTNKTTFNFTLQASSPAIDAGNNTGAPATDFLGVSRPQNSIVDIGAYESIPSNPVSYSANVYQGVTVSAGVNQNEVYKRRTTQLIALSNSAGNTETYRRAISQIITPSHNTITSILATRKTTQVIAVAQITGRGWIATRVSSQVITVSHTINRRIYQVKQAVHSISVSSTIKKSSLFNRSIAQGFLMQNWLDKYRGYSKRIIQNFAVSQAVIDSETFRRIAAQTITAAHNTKRSIWATRKIIQTTIINHIQKKQLTANRRAAQSITVIQNINKYFTRLAEGTVNLLVSADTKGNRIVDRAASQVIQVTHNLYSRIVSIIQAVISCNSYCYLGLNSFNKTLKDLDAFQANDTLQGAYNASTQKWETHRTGYAFNENVTVYEKWGYYYYFNKTTNISMRLNETTNITLLKGWNLVGNFGNARTLLQLRTSTGANATAIQYYDRVLKTWVSDNAQIVPPGEAIMIYVTNQTRW